MASLLFGIAHAITPAYLVLAALIGEYLGGLWLWTGNLLAPIIAHAGYDFIALWYLAKGAQKRRRQGRGQKHCGVPATLRLDAVVPPPRQPSKAEHGQRAQENVQRTRFGHGHRLRLVRVDVDCPRLVGGFPRLGRCAERSRVAGRGSAIRG